MHRHHSTQNCDLTVDDVVKAVASYYGIRTSRITSENRHKSVATARAVAMYIARQHIKDSYPDLARSFGGKHHTTVIAAVQKITERVKEDASLRAEISMIESALLGDCAVVLHHLGELGTGLRLAIELIEHPGRCRREVVDRLRRVADRTGGVGDIWVTDPSAQLGEQLHLPGVM